MESILENAQEFIVPIIVIGCLVVGYIIKPKVIVDEVKEDLVDNVQEAIDSCPTDAIEWVK